VNYSEVDRIIDRTYMHTWAAMQAVQIHLPQDSSSRLTASGSRVGHATGFGLGYAYKFDRDDNLAISAGIGTSAGEEVGVLSVGFEFGGDRGSTYRYDDANLNRRMNELEYRLAEAERQNAVTREYCSEAANRTHRICTAK
jgi:hypothetical protein